MIGKIGKPIYVNTSRMMNDGHNEIGTGERKLIWDEENRLLAVDDNGFVSNYWYDADGERTVKTSGESDQVYVNGVFSGGSTNTAKFSLYVSPYLVANQGGRYTKHIYAGSQRIVSKVGDFASYGSDPRRIEYAGANTDGLSVNYKAKYAAQQQVIKDNYKTFDVPYNGTDNDNYADGEGFCCNDGSMEAAVARTKAQARAVARSFKDPDNYENLQFFYHPDHLGSSNFITNLEGEVVQHIEYVPFGEVFIEERNNVWNTPYLFNAKEFDEETGMYYYGARYYEPRLSLWMSTDPYDEDFPNITSYAYCNNNPIILTDPDGNSPTVITGLIGGGIGGFIGGAIEAGTQLYKHGKITNWNAVGGAAAQGAITGAAAGLTCGATLVVTVGASSASNVVGGFVNRTIQGQETTATDVVADAAIGGVAGSIGGASGKLTKKSLDAASASTKGKIGEATTQIKYALKGYKSNGKAVVETGKPTATGRPRVAKYDFEMQNVFTGKVITVESKFNKSGFTRNQRDAFNNVKTPFKLDRTTSTQFQKGVQSTVNFGVQQGANKQKND